MAFTFRKEPRETGLSSIANPNPSTKVKLNGKVVGMIAAPSRFGESKWAPRITIKKEITTDSPCPWKWIFFKAKFDTEPEAREWFKKNEAVLLERYEIVSYED